MKGRGREGRNGKSAKAPTPRTTGTLVPRGAKGRTLRQQHTPTLPAGRVDAVRLVSGALDQRLGGFMLRLREARTRATETAIHDLRVAMRRLIAVLDLAGEIAPDAGIPSLRRKLRKDLKRFNALRDVHISLLAMASLQRTLPAVRLYMTVLRTRERVLLRECAASLRGIDERSVERSVATVQQFLFAAGADPAISTALTAALMGAMGQIYVRAVRALRNVNAADASTIHRLRITFKKVRYAAEVLAPLTGGVTKARKKWMGEYQTLMGEVQDCEVMIAGARRFAATTVAGRRIPMIAVQEELARRKRERLAAFLQRASELEREHFIT